eukprot:scaffold909_cov121-Isochrysis_galbana.AAC.5
MLCRASAESVAENSATCSDPPRPPAPASASEPPEPSRVSGDGARPAPPPVGCSAEASGGLGRRAPQNLSGEWRGARGAGGQGEGFRG